MTNVPDPVFVNGDFEQDNFASQTQITTSNLTGWTHSGGFEFVDVNTYITAQSGDSYVSWGHSFVVGGALQQTVATEVGGTYKLTYYVSQQQGNDPNQVARAEVIDAVGASVISSLDTLTTMAVGTWVQRTITFTATSTSTTIRFFDATNPSDGGGSNWSLDSVSLVSLNNPVAVADTPSATTENAGIVVDVLSNDSDFDTEDVLSIQSIQSITSGNVIGLGSLSPADLAEINAAFTIVNGNTAITFAPAAGLPGAESVFDRLNPGDTATVTLTYTVSDGQGGAASTTVTFTINGDYEYVTGDNTSQTLAGTVYADQITGMDGDDVIEGGAAADVLDGGLNGTSGDTVSYAGSTAAVTVNLTSNSASGGHATGDTLSGFENVTGSSQADTLTGNLGNNVLKGLGGGDTLNGSGGLGDLADYSDSDAAVTVNLSTGVHSGGHAAGDTLIQIENLTGSTFGDSLSANSYQNILKGGDGNDIMNAAGNNDQLFGDAGDDTLAGGTGADIIDGGSNTAVGDTVSFSNAAARIILTLTNGAGTATGSGQGVGDTITNIENILGSNFNDIFTGDANANTINGLGGNDNIKGGAGNDTILGGGGLDVLEGGQGNDSITGGPDADTFVYRSTENFGQDTITGFQNNQDKFDLIGAGFDFADFTKSQSGADTLLTLTADPTQTIRLIGINQSNIDATDFI